MMSENQYENLEKDSELSEKMAVQFPDWDLLPPDVLIKRTKDEQQSD